MQRTFLLGAGFSKAVADGPLMSEIWEYIEKAYEREKSRTVLGLNNRLEWFKELDNFVKEFEEEATFGFNQKEFDKIRVGIKENLEYLFTVIDLHTQENGPKIEFGRKGVDISPYPVIPFRFIGKDRLEETKRCLLTFLYIIFENLKGNNKDNEFGKIISEKDQIITFNYDLVLEKALWQRNIWSPLNGYVGVDKFAKEDDKKKLEEANKYSRIKIHKMHGSICWVKSDHSEHILIKLDNKENWGFHFDGLEKMLEREPTGQFEGQISKGYVGKHDPPWMLPSFVKPFERKEFYEIWKSALKVMSKTDELIIIGYSFRPEDSNSQLLIASLPDECNLILIDRHPEKIKERLEKKGLKIKTIHNSLQHYLST